MFNIKDKQTYITRLTLTQEQMLEIVLTAQEIAVTGVILSGDVFDTAAEHTEAILQTRVLAQGRLINQILLSAGYILALPIGRTVIGDGTVLFTQTIIRCKLSGI